MKTLVVSLSNISTGELTYFLNALKICSEEFKKSISFLVNKNLMPKNGINHYHIIDTSPKALQNLSQLEQLAFEYSNIWFLDLNATLLEQSASFIKHFNTTIASLHKKNCSVSLIDLFHSFTHDENHYNKEVQRIRKESTALKEVAGKNKMYFFNKFLEPRAIQQLYLVDKRINILRPVPLSYPHLKENTSQHYYRVDFPNIPLKKKKTLVLFAVSSINIYFINKVYGKNGITFLQEIFKLFVSTVNGIDHRIQIIAIDPEKILENIIPTNESCTVHGRITPEELTSYLSEAYFCCTTNPFSSIATNCTLNAIPFVSLCSNSFSNKVTWMDDIFENTYLPPFKSFGMFEGDLAWKGLLNNNSFFDLIFFANLADQSHLKTTLQAAIANQKKNDYTGYLNIVKQTPSLEEVIELTNKNLFTESEEK